MIDKINDLKINKAKEQKIKSNQSLMIVCCLCNYLLSIIHHIDLQCPLYFFDEMFNILIIQKRMFIYIKILNEMKQLA